MLYVVGYDFALGSNFGSKMDILEFWRLSRSPKKETRIAFRGRGSSVDVKK